MKQTHQKNGLDVRYSFISYTCFNYPFLLTLYIQSSGIIRIHLSIVCIFGRDQEKTKGSPGVWKRKAPQSKWSCMDRPNV